MLSMRLSNVRGEDVVGEGRYVVVVVMVVRPVDQMGGAKRGTSCLGGSGRLGGCLVVKAVLCTLYSKVTL